MAKPVYFDTSIFIEMATSRSKFKANLKTLLAEFQQRKIRVYTSILTVQEMSVASYRQGTVARDTTSLISGVARIYNLTLEVALTAAKREAEIKDMIASNEPGPNKQESEEQKLERICGNRRRKWDALHLATAQVLECSTIYSTDRTLQRRPSQLGLKNLVVIAPPVSTRRIVGSLFPEG